MRPPLKYIRESCSDEKGIALIFVIASVVFFSVVFLIFVDVAYLYFIRGQLHNAADASVLAGAQFIDKDRGANDQPLADTEAVKYAFENLAAGEKVVVVPATDTSFGTWNWSTRVYTPDAEPVNAMKVIAGRTEDRTDGEFGLFFGKLLESETNPDGIETLPIRSYAIAAIPEKVEAPIALCTDSTNPGVPLPHDFYWSPYTAETDPGIYGIAWTLFDTTSQATPSMELIDFFCKQPLGKCPDDPVFLNNGGVNAAARQFRCAFYNPDHDRYHKTFDSMDNTKVLSWNVLTPVLDRCPPGDQPLPQQILGYAWVTLTDVYASGLNHSKCACQDLFTDHPSVYNKIKLTGKSPNGVEIEAINYPANVEVNACPKPRHLGISRLVE